MERSEERNQFLDDIIEGALYGCSYWATGEVRNGVQEIWETEGDDPNLYPEMVKTLDRELIAKGIAKIISTPDFKVRKDIRTNIYLGNIENDAGNIDAECCDVIVQAGIFGEIIFG